MGERFSSISDKHSAFIVNQKIFFVGTATEDSRINISPKGMDSLRVLGPNRVIWLNLTGSGNETSAHIQQCPRMTIMFAAFEGKPLILRLYGKASIIHHGDNDWESMMNHFDSIPGARQIFDVQIDLVQSSCGYAVPFYDFVEERTQLRDWAKVKGDDGVQDYWRQKNQVSLDGKSIELSDSST